MSRRGVVVVVLVLVLALVHLAVMGSLEGGGDDSAGAAARVESARALYAGEGVLRIGLRELSVGYDVDGDGTIGSVSNDGTSSNDPIVGLGRGIVTAGTSSGVTTLQASARSGAGGRGITAELLVTPPTTTGHGLLSEYYAIAGGVSSLGGVTWSSPLIAGVTPHANWAQVAATVPFWASGRSTLFAARLRGTILIPAAGSWTFQTTSDDGSQIWIDGSLIVNNDGVHTWLARSAAVTLTEGDHDLEIRHFQRATNYGLIASWRGPGMAAIVPIPASALTPRSGWATATPATGIVVSDTATITGNNAATACFIDGFDSALGPYGGGNVLTNRTVLTTYASSANRVVMRQRSQVRGNVSIGPTGTGSTVSLGTGAAVTGSVSKVPNEVAIPATPGSAAAFPPTAGNATISAPVTWEGRLHYGTLTISGSGAVTVNGNVTVMCDSNLSMTGSSRIDLSPGARLTMIINGAATFNNTCRVNLNTGDPRRVNLTVMGNSRRVRLLTSARVCAQVRNPLGTLEVSGNTASPGEFFGSFVGTSITLTQRGQIHADVRASADSGVGGSDPAVSVAEWLDGHGLSP